MTLSNRFFRAAFVFFAVGISLGVMMSVSRDFTLRPVHVHVNLIGWVGFFIYGAFYRLFPQVAETKLALSHFWSALVGLPPMLIGLGFIVTGTPEIGGPMLMAGEAITVVSVALFLIAGFKATRTPAATMDATADTTADAVEPRAL